MTKEKAIELLNIYGKAWVTRDPELIVTIFTDDATYDDPHEPRNDGIEAIRQYWKTKVIGEQKDISFKLLNTWIDQGGRPSWPNGMRNSLIRKGVYISK